MTVPTIAPPLPVRTPGGSLHRGEVHATCCREEDPGDVALCGTEVAGEWMSRDVSPTCVVCIDLDEADCDDDAPACPLMALAKGRRR